VPPLLWWYDDQDDTGWVVLVFEEIDGQHPAQPWRVDELHRVVDALAVLHKVLTPSPLPAGMAPTAGEHFASTIRGWQSLQDEGPSYIERLDDWSVRHLAALIQLEQAAVEAVAGDTLLNFDVRADNILLAGDRVWFLDWPHASVGAAWVDVVLFAPSVTMQGGPPPEAIIQRYPACHDADPAAITAAVAAMAGFFTYGALRPPPPGLPTVRQFQNAQGIVAREWLAQRMGWM
jgi:Ser/Thr protein kinase RdoA (MazF antagonist)